MTPKPARKPHRINPEFSAEQYARIQQAAENQGRSVKNFAEFAINQAAEPPKPEEPRAGA